MHQLIIILATLAAAPSAGTSETVLHRWEFNRPGDLEGWHTPQDMRDVTVADGRLQFTATGMDPFIYAPAIDVPMDGGLLRVAIRCAHKADTQVFWITADSPVWSQEQVLTLPTQRYAPASRPHAPTTTGPSVDEMPFSTLEFKIGKTTDAGRRLTGLRLDPCNGPVGERVQIDRVELVRQAPVVQAMLSFDGHRAALNQAVNLQVTLAQFDGAREESGFTAQLAGMPVPPGGEAAACPVSAGLNSAAPRASAGWQMSFDRAGVHRQQVVVTAGGRERYDLQTSVMVGDGDTLPVRPALRTERIRLDFIPAVDGEHIGAARWMACDAAGGWHQGGWLLPLVRLVVQRGDGTVLAREPALNLHAAEPRWARLEGSPPDLPDWRVQVDFEVKGATGLETIEVTATLEGPAGGQLLEFAAPLVRVDREVSMRNPGAAGQAQVAGDDAGLLDRFGLFGGLEMLEPGWRSSSERAVGEKFAQRWAPHPFKITVPAMAIEAAGLTTALLWQPLDKWDGQHALPKASFASPNFIDGQPNHLMALAVPSIPAWSRENEPWARTAYTMSAGQPLTLRATLYAEAGLPAAMVSARWYHIFGTPLPPPPAHADAALDELIARSYGETMYDPVRHGWTQHWYFPQEPAFQRELASFLLAHAARTGNAHWVESTGIVGGKVIDVAGTLSTRLSQDAHARAMASSMRPDGTWPFVNTEEMRRQTRAFTNGKYDALGPDNATSVGTCAMPALAILEQAEKSGDAALTAAGLHALQAMRRFRVPRGAQVWEVAMEIPDIRAAALAVKAFQIGYRLTGDRSYLEDAHYWGWTGAAFTYAWQVPLQPEDGVLEATWHRDDANRIPILMAYPYASGRPQITPYGTVPVLGTTFYVINWFGVLVQWCGLEWAQHVIELDADRPDPLLRYIADGVVLSGLQQMMDRPPWVGLYPDSWILDENRAQASLIYPGLILKCRQAQGRLPDLSTPWTRILRDGEARVWHVSGWGTPLQLDAPGISWSATVAFLPGEPNELLIAGVESPRSVRAGEGVLDRLAEGQAEGTSFGWRYDANRRAVLVRFLQAEPQMRIQMGW